MMRPGAQQYVVARPLYSEESFDGEHEKVYRHRKTMLDHFKEYFTCDAKRAKNAALSLLPVIGWLRIYRIKEWLLSDIVSGVSTGLVAVLQGLAYCLLASLPPWYGLFSAFFPVVIYFFLGTSRHISVGPFPVLCLMIGSVVTRLVPDEGPPFNITGFEGLTQDEQRVLVASSVTFLAGIMQLAMGVLQVGFVVMYLSDTLVSGFTTAAAVHILVSQLKFVLGLTVRGISGPLAIIYTLEIIFNKITSSNVCDVVISLVIMVVVFIVKELNDRFKSKLPVPIPIEVIMTVIACGVSYAFDFRTRYGIDVVGHIPKGYEPPMAPNLHIFQETAVEAFPMAIVGFAVAFSVAKVYSVKHDYTIDGNQELIAFGVSNIFGASFKSFAASTALSRSAVQESTGGKTQVAGLLSAIIVMIVTLAIGYLLDPLPKSVLGAVVIVNLKGMLMQFRDIPYLWRRDKPDCVVWIGTCIASILLGLDLGLAAGLGIELISVVLRTQFPRCSVLANIKGTDIYKDRKDYIDIYEPEGVKVFRIPSPIFFANIEFFKTKLVEAIGFSPLRVLRKRNKALRTIRKLLKKGDLQWTSKGFLNASCGPIKESEDQSKMEELDLPTDFKDLPARIDWNAELPANIVVPKVDLHSLILDFAAVSFLDISALKGLKTMLKELIRVEVEVYIVACDTYILEKLHNCCFFDDEVKPSMFFLTLHDAMLHILEKHPESADKKSDFDKIITTVTIHHPTGSLRSRDRNVPGVRMATLRRQYAVARPVYSEDSFSEDYEKIYRRRKTTLDHVKEYLTCDSKRAKNAVLSFLPIIGWMRIYRVKEWLLGDVVSGVSTGLVAIMQGLAFSLLAELPPSYGLFTACFPMLTYFFLGTSRHISVGSFPVLSLMVGAVVIRLVPKDGPAANITAFEGLNPDQQRVLVASSVTFLMGIFQLAMGVLQVGFIVVYLSDTLVSGFTTAAAVHILVSQLKFVLGLTVPGFNGPLAIIYTLKEIFVQITATNICDLVMSILIMLAVFIVKELNEIYKAKLPVPIPIEVIMTIIACGVSYGFNFEKRFDVEIVGKMVSGYESPIAPSMQVFQESAVEAFPIAIVGFAVAFSVAKVYSIKHDYTIDGNQELIAFGVSNIFGASFRSFAASTALSRTAVQESSGGKTQIAGLISAMMAMIVTVALGFLLEPLPRSVLGALVIVNLKGMLMQFREIPYLWRRDKPECVVWVVTCVAAILLGLDLGLAVGLGVELLSVIFRTQFPRCSILANIPGTDLYRDRKDYLHIFEPEGVKIFRIPSPIFFANIEFFKDKLVEAVGFNPLKVLRKRNKALRKFKKLLQKNNDGITEKSLRDLFGQTTDELNVNMKELDLPTDVKDLPFRMDWNAELPADINVPRVDLHSLILDFSAVSFLDISAMKGLKTALREFIRIDVDVYIVSCDVYIVEKLHSCMFFNDEILTSMFFPTLHDAMLHVLEKKKEDRSKGTLR
ncbi:chloride anion exchanger-like [Symphorus nematophorus]